MHLPSAIFVMLLITCRFFLATLAQQQPLKPAVRGNTAISASCIPRERDALLAFKHGITGDHAGLLSSWRLDGSHGEQDCCQWEGVRCSNPTGHVHKLRLPRAGTALVGKISPSLLGLEHLEYLDLRNNKLEGPTGRLPEFLGSLKPLPFSRAVS
ncbi:unnamed protein product [Urochloa humidicola]